MGAVMELRVVCTVLILQFFISVAYGERHNTHGNIEIGRAKGGLIGSFFHGKGRGLLEGESSVGPGPDFGSFDGSLFTRGLKTDLFSGLDSREFGTSFKNSDGSFSFPGFPGSERLTPIIPSKFNFRDSSIRKPSVSGHSPLHVTKLDDEILSGGIRSGSGFRSGISIENSVRQKDRFRPETHFKPGGNIGLVSNKGPDSSIHSGVGSGFRSNSGAGGSAIGLKTELELKNNVGHGKFVQHETKLNQGSEHGQGVGISHIGKISSSSHLEHGSRLKQSNGAVPFQQAPVVKDDLASAVGDLGGIGLLGGSQLLKSPLQIRGSTTGGRYNIGKLGNSLVNQVLTEVDGGEVLKSVWKNGELHTTILLDETIQGVEGFDEAHALNEKPTDTIEFNRQFGNDASVYTDHTKDFHVGNVEHLGSLSHRGEVAQTSHIPVNTKSAHHHKSNIGHEPLQSRFTEPKRVLTPQLLSPTKILHNDDFDDAVVTHSGHGATGFVRHGTSILDESRSRFRSHGGRFSRPGFSSFRGSGARSFVQHNPNRPFSFRRPGKF